MKESILFILLNKEDYTYSHALVYKSSLFHSIQTKVVEGYNKFEPIELTEREYANVTSNGVVELPTNLVYKVFAKRIEE